MLADNRMICLRNLIIPQLLWSLSVIMYALKRLFKNLYIFQFSDSNWNSKGYLKQFLVTLSSPPFWWYHVFTFLRFVDNFWFLMLLFSNLLVNVFWYIVQIQDRMKNCLKTNSIWNGESVMHFHNNPQSVDAHF